MFYYVSLCKTCVPRGGGGGGHFCPHGHNLKKLGRGPIDDATNQISRL